MAVMIEKSDRRADRKRPVRERTSRQQHESEQLTQDIAERLLIIRKHYDIGQISLAKSLKMTRQRWANYEKGQRRIDLDVVVALCDRFDMSADWLIRGIGNGPRAPVGKSVKR